MRLAGSRVLPRCAYFSANPNGRSRLEIIAAEDAKGIERLELGSGRRIVERRRQIKTLDAGVEVRRVKSDDFRIMRRGLRQQFFVGPNQVREFHPILVRIPAWSQDMPLHKDRVFVVGRDRKDVNGITVSDGECLELLLDGLVVSGRRKIQGQHGALFMGFDALDLNVSQRCGGQDAAGQLKNFGNRRFTMQFVNGRPPNHALDSNLWSDGWDEQSVAIFETVQI